MIAGARVEVAAYKKDPRDFVLWKPSKPGEPAWPSPAGIKAPGRPGWHIECSAMAWKYLREIFDIHGGGIDLVFPHHEDEIAQSRCAFHTPVMANYWMHNGFLQVEGEKMAKSAGNFVTIHELLVSNKFGEHNWPGAALRFAMLQTHYRQPIDWTTRSLEVALHTLDDFFRMATDAVVDTPSQGIQDAIKDDLNTPLAIAELHNIRKKVHRPGQGEAAEELGRNLKFLGMDRREFFKWTDREDERVKRNAGQIDELIEARNVARAQKNFKESDRIRDELAKMGVVLKDSKDGTTWEIAR
jgi:cysteinyl-tRNA synthetase